jgi:putative ABC transport system permease protein
MLDDLRLAVRAPLKAPGFSTVALLTLTLGIAASAAAFTILYAVLLRPLPYPDPDRLVILFGRSMSTDRLSDWQQRTRSYDAFAALAPGVPNVYTPDGPERVRSLLVSRDFCPTLSLRASAGACLARTTFARSPPLSSSPTVWPRASSDRPPPLSDRLFVWSGPATTTSAMTSSARSTPSARCRPARSPSSCPCFRCRVPRCAR